MASTVDNQPNPETETLPEITKAFLEKALKNESGETPEILSYRVSKGTNPGDNYTSIILTIDVELLQPPTKRHLFIKCYPNHSQQFLNKKNLFFKELEIYRKWIPELKRFQIEVAGLNEDQAVILPYAPFVYGECIDFQSSEGKLLIHKTFQSLDNFIVLEDVRKSEGFRMPNKLSTLDLDHMRLVVTALARIHSLSWAYSQLVEPNVTGKFPCLISPITGLEAGSWSKLVFPNLDIAKSVYDAEFGEGNALSQGTQRLKEIFPTVFRFFKGWESGASLEPLLRVPPSSGKFGKDAENPADWKVISHGDCWSNNMLFKYDPETRRPTSIILVDLQMVQETCVVNDLVYVMYACTERALRQSHLDELLQLYHDTFNEVCSRLGSQTLPGFSLESLKYRFHRAKLVGYFLANVDLAINFKEAEKVTNLEKLGKGQSSFDALSVVGNSTEYLKNEDFKNRLIGVAQDMFDDGVL